MKNTLIAILVAALVLMPGTTRAQVAAPVDITAMLATLAQIQAQLEALLAQIAAIPGAATSTLPMATSTEPGPIIIEQPQPLIFPGLGAQEGATVPVPTTTPMFPIQPTQPLPPWVPGCQNCPPPAQA